MKKITVMISILLAQMVLSVSLAAETPDKYPTLGELLIHIDPDTRAVLMNEKEAVVFHDGPLVPEVLPFSGFTEPIRQEIADGGLTLGMEGLYLLGDLPPGYRNSPSRERTLKIYNILRSVSTLKGLEYYSETSNKMKTLFEDSWAIDGFESKNKIPDPLVSELKPYDSISIYQKDNRFSKNQYTMSFRNEEANLSTSIINHTPLKVSGVIKMVDPEEMQIHIAIMPYQEGLAVYVMMAAATDTRSFRSKAQQSFGNRAIALKNWFEQRMGEEF